MHSFALVSFQIFCVIIFRDKFGCILEHVELKSNFLDYYEELK